MSSESDIGASNPELIIASLNCVGFYVGLGLAIFSSLFIGSSFIIKKKALIKLNRMGAVRAGAGGFGYLKEWTWWAGLICMGLGEAANFAAYAFAPASLVTPLGALSVLVAAVMASRFLHERLNLLGKLGCLLCILGSTIIVIHSPKEEEIESLNDLLEKLQEPAFVSFVLFVILISVLIAFYFGPKYGHKHVSVFLILCSAVGSLTVMGCKGLGLALRETMIGSSNDFSSWLVYVFFFTVVTCICVQMNYLNRALDMFNTSIVTPVYYVMFTSLVIAASAILFKEWNSLGADDVVGNLCGFLIVIIGIVLLNAFREIDISIHDVKDIMKPKREAIPASDRVYEESLIKNEGRKTSISRYGTDGITRNV